MNEPRISRRQVLIGAGAVGALSPLVNAIAALAGSEVELLRWDLVKVASAASTLLVVTGGEAVGKDRPTGDTNTLTGSGQASVEKRKAAGGGTFVHKIKAGGSISGVYFVTGFRSFENPGGSLAGIGLTDGIGNIADTTGGTLLLDVRLVSTMGTLNAVLGIVCHLPGGPDLTEGITLTVTAAGRTFNFVQDSGNTLFHVLED